MPRVKGEMNGSVVGEETHLWDYALGEVVDVGEKENRPQDSLRRQIPNGHHQQRLSADDCSEMSESNARYDQLYHTNAASRQV